VGGGASPGGAATAGGTRAGRRAVGRGDGQPTDRPSGQGRRRTRPDRVLADKAYSSVAIRTALRARGIKATIPSKANEITGRAHRGSKGGRPPAFDKAAYKTRNVVERTINKLRLTRAVATRYDKREFVYRGTIDVASIRIWLRDPPETHSRDTPYAFRASPNMESGGNRVFPLVPWPSCARPRRKILGLDSPS